MTLGNFMKTVDGDTMALFTICNIYNAEYTHQFLYDKTVKYIKENKLASKKVTRIGIDYVEQKSYTPYDDCIEVTVFVE